MVSFNIIENPEPDYDIEEVIKDYKALILTSEEIRRKHGISCGKWHTIIKEIKN